MLLVKNKAGYEVLINLQNVTHVVGTGAKECKVYFITKECLMVMEPMKRFVKAARP